MLEKSATKPSLDGTGSSTVGKEVAGTSTHHIGGVLVGTSSPSFARAIVPSNYNCTREAILPAPSLPTKETSPAALLPSPSCGADHSKLAEQTMDAQQVQQGSPPWPTTHDPSTYLCTAFKSPNATPGTADLSHGEDTSNKENHNPVTDPVKSRGRTRASLKLQPTGATPTTAPFSVRSTQQNAIPPTESTPEKLSFLVSQQLDRVHRLHRMITEATRSPRQRKLLRWSDEGSGFHVYVAPKGASCPLASLIATHYPKPPQLRSILRRFEKYGGKRSGPDSGCLVQHPFFHRDDPDLTKWRQAVSNNQILTSQAIQAKGNTSPQHPQENGKNGPASITPYELRNSNAEVAQSERLLSLTSNDVADELATQPKKDPKQSQQSCETVVGTMPQALTAVTPFNQRDFSPVPPSMGECEETKRVPKVFSVLHPRVEVICRPTAVYVHTHQRRGNHGHPPPDAWEQPLPLLAPGANHRNVSRQGPFNQMYSNRSGIAVSPMATGPAPRLQPFFPTTLSDSSNAPGKEARMYKTPMKRSHPDASAEGDNPTSLFTGDSSAFTPLLSATSFNTDVFSPPDGPSLAALWIEPRDLEDCLADLDENTDDVADDTSAAKKDMV